MARSLGELVDDREPAWPQVCRWIAGARGRVEVLPRERARAEHVLLQLQVTTRSALGSVAYESGGILIDDGWIRVLGCGGDRMVGSLASWNALGKGLEGTRGLLIVAHDVVGGFFALDGGALGAGTGGAYYFAPDSLRWEELERGYADLLEFLLAADLDQFYGPLRWTGWQREVSRLSPDEGFSLYPPPFTAEGKDVARSSRRAVPMMALYALQIDIAKQLNGGG